MNTQIMKAAKVAKVPKVAKEPKVEKVPKEPHQKSKDEDVQLSRFIAVMSGTDGPIKQKIHAPFHALTGETVASVAKAAGRGHHYDLVITTESGKTYKVEHKGSCRHTPIAVDQAPWKTGVQFFNGPANKFTIGTIFARKWHAGLIESGALSREYGVETPVPAYAEWSKDAFCQGKPKTAFVNELREKTDKGTKIAKSEMRGTFLREFAISAEERQQMVAEVERQANSVLAEKELWLQIHGDIDGEFNIHWSPRVEPIRLTDVIVKTGGVNMEFDFVCDGAPVIHSILRWGYGQGITNLRMDLK